ncbi:MAG: T9SS type A sorting domain-containing protein [Saprospiraceae bacterium]|nr:T9SS type A sorting domain-containing protein [Saprospiraceae bacterium]
MKNYRIYLTFIILLIYNTVDASIFCPPDKTIYCHDDRTYLPLTGTPIVFGYPQQMLRYVDQNFLNTCNAGYVDRRWYVDVNQDGSWQSGEGFCVQRLTVLYVEQPIQVIFPPDRMYNCKEDIKLDKPTWVAGPCDVIGSSYKDEIFEIAPDACYKIMRTFTVINWCNPQGSGNGQTWTHKQVIKVVETAAPSIAKCQPEIFNTAADCKAEIILENSATDDSSCPSQLLSWQVQVDLWSNGTIDYKYGFLEKDEFFIAPVINGSQISFTLPERVGIGKHKVFWSVRDQCGNFRTCHTYFEVKDQKKPTPYMHQFLTTAFRGNQMNLEIKADLFNVGSFDNCTPSKKLKYSFSPDVNDTVRVVTCNNFGFQFYTIYVTDEAGNSEYIEAFLLVFDNGSCNFNFSFDGRVLHSNGTKLENVNVELVMNDHLEMQTSTDVSGNFSFEDVSLNQGYSLEFQMDESLIESVNIEDFIRLKNYLFGLDNLEHFELVAADMNNDFKINASDLKILKDRILRPSTYFQNHKQWKLILDAPEEINAGNLKSLKRDFLLLNYDGFFDISAVVNGDITGANEPTTEFRNTVNVYWQKNEDSWELKVADKINVNGIQLEVSLNSLFSENLQVISSDRNLNGEQLYIDQENKLLRVLLAEKAELQENATIIRLQNVENVEKALPILLNESFMVDERGNLYKVRLEQSNIISNSTSIISPNPGNGLFTLNDLNATVLNISDIDGRPVSFGAKDGQIYLTAPAGIYIIQYLSSGKLLTNRFVVSD